MDRVISGRARSGFRCRGIRRVRVIEPGKAPARSGGPCRRPEGLWSNDILIKTGGEKMKHFKIAVSVIAVLSFIVFCAPAISADEVTGNININTATAEELATLKYVGDKLSQRIVEYRDENGSFQSAADITKVPGIGPKVLELNQDIMTVE
ncbi:MAG TPA: ComEA family DNA-binding protein [Deltaproteobacteria bacterium]|nr:ComEA family DNA-binding protein [Deltaproteobacteria bacterium]